MTTNPAVRPLKAALNELGWSYTRLISEMRAIAAGDGKKLPKSESLTSMISRWVNGRERPDEFYQTLLCKALRRPAAELGFGDGPASLLARASAAAEPWELMEALERTSIGPGALEELERTAVRYVLAYPSTPPMVLLDPVIGHLRRVIDKLNQGQAPSRRRRLASVAAQLAATAGSLAFDLRNPEKANAYFRGAMMAGDEAEDDDLRAWVLATHSLVPTYAGDCRSALKLLDRALAFAANSGGPTRRSWVAALKARAHAGLGQRKECYEALGIAEDSMDRLTDVDKRSPTDFFDRPRLEALRGSCLLGLGQAQKAERILQDALSSRDASHVKGCTLVRLDLASVYIRTKNLDGARHVITQVMDTPPDIRVEPVIRQARIIRLELRPWRASQVAKEMDEQLQSAFG